MPAANPSYDISSCCNTHCCMYEMSDDEPCWGRVAPVEEIGGADASDYYGFVHACEGHIDAWDGGKYKPEQT